MGTIISKYQAKEQKRQNSQNGKDVKTRDNVIRNDLGRKKNGILKFLPKIKNFRKKSNSHVDEECSSIEFKKTNRNRIPDLLNIPNIDQCGRTSLLKEMNTRSTQRTFEAIANGTREYDGISDITSGEGEYNTDENDRNDNQIERVDRGIQSVSGEGPDRGRIDNRVRRELKPHIQISHRRISIGMGVKTDSIQENEVDDNMLVLSSIVTGIRERIDDCLTRIMLHIHEISQNIPSLPQNIQGRLSGLKVFKDCILIQNNILKFQEISLEFQKLTSEFLATNGMHPIILKMQNIFLGVQSILIFLQKRGIVLMKATFDFFHFNYENSVINDSRNTI